MTYCTKQDEIGNVRSAWDPFMDDLLPRIATNPNIDPRTCLNEVPVHLCSTVCDDISYLPELVNCPSENCREIAGETEWLK